MCPQLKLQDSKSFPNALFAAPAEPNEIREDVALSLQWWTVNRHKWELESFVICKYASHSFKNYLHNRLQLVMYVIEISFIEINFASRCGLIFPFLLFSVPSTQFTQQLI